MTGSGTLLDPYIITSRADLEAIDDDLTAYYELGSDIDLTTGGNWVPLGNLTGQLDGKNYTISNMTVSIAGYAGLFSEFSAGTIQNLKIVDCSISSSSDNAGAFAGYSNGGTITNCSSTGTITNTGWYTGGLIGEIANCTVSKCLSTVVVIGTWYSGGLIGRTTISSSVTDCYARGAVTGTIGVGGFSGTIEGASSFTNCYSTGLVTGNVGEFGGLVSDSYGGSTCTNCFWDTQTSGTLISAGGTGKTTAEMTTQSTFTGWDFTTIWAIDAAINDGYPYLQWEIPTIIPLICKVLLPDQYAIIQVVKVPHYKRLYLGNHNIWTKSLVDGLDNYAQGKLLVVKWNDDPIVWSAYPGGSILYSRQAGSLFYKGAPVSIWDSYDVGGTPIAFMVYNDTEETILEFNAVVNFNVLYLPGSLP